MFSCKKCQPVPVKGGRGKLGGGLVEVEGRAVWGVPDRVYVLDGAKWKKMADGVRDRARLAVCGGDLVFVGGLKDDGGYSKHDGYSKEVVLWRRGRWTSMCNMLVGCGYTCVVSISGGGMVVMGGQRDDGSSLRDVQVFDGKTWHFGPPLPERCYSMSAVVHRDQVFVMGGWGMKQAVWSANITELVSH